MITVAVSPEIKLNLINSKMQSFCRFIAIINTAGVSQIAYFCTKYLIFQVHNSTDFIHIEVCKNAVYYWCTQNGPKIERGMVDTSHSMNAILITKWHNGVSVVANVSIH